MQHTFFSGHFETELIADRTHSRCNCDNSADVLFIKIRKLYAWYAHLASLTHPFAYLRKFFAIIATTFSTRPYRRQLSWYHKWCDMISRWSCTYANWRKSSECIRIRRVKWIINKKRRRIECYGEGKKLQIKVRARENYRDWPTYIISHYAHYLAGLCEDDLLLLITPLMLLEPILVELILIASS